MPVIVDTHVHVYPEYDVGRFLVDTAARLRSLAPGATPAICLAERAGQHLFTEWAAGDRVPGTELGLETVRGRGGDALRVEAGDGPLYILPGRQIVTAERLEVLALGRDLELVDGTAAAELIRAILAADGIPVLSWAFGKWWFARSRKVRELVAHFAPERLWLGDTTMRPKEWPYGRMMRRAISAGTRVLAGSDPLPGKREACQAGRYATLLHSELDPSDPAGSVLHGFRTLPPRGRSVGRRGTLGGVLLRMAR